MKDGYKIIDMRLRPPYKGFLNQGFPFGLYDIDFAFFGLKLTGKTASPALINESMDVFVREMDMAGVDLGVAPYRAAWGDKVNNRPKTNNQDLIDLQKEYPNRFIGIPCLSPTYNTLEENLAEIQKYCVEGGLRGIMMEPYIDNPNWFMNDEERVYPILEKCQELQLPVLLTFGSFAGYPEEQIPALLEAVHAFPQVNFVLCHGAYPYTDKFCHAAFINQNLYISPDMYFINTHVRQMYWDAANYTLNDRMMFGSAYPGIPLQFAVDYYLAALREEVKANIMYRNAARLFKLELR